MPARNIPASVLILGVTGSVLAYSGLKGKGISSSIQALLAGQSPSTAAQTDAIVATESADPATQETQVQGGLGDVPGAIQNQGSSGTLQSFYVAVLQKLGKPVTQGNLNALAGIVQTEGSNSYYNPFNIEYHSGDNSTLEGVTNFNDVGVQEYGSFDQGVNATVALLNQPHWAAVNTALSSGNQALVEASLRSAYTWAQFKTAGNNALKLLNGSVG